jgi:hypothetical protein
MALKKRGFNVERILNQQREEKLRVQAEAVRDREKQALELANRPSVESTAVARSTVSNAPGKPEYPVESGKGKGFFERLRTRRTSASSEGPQMPGGFGSLGLGGGLGGMAGGVTAPGRGGVSTKRVSIEWI